MRPKEQIFKKRCIMSDFKEVLKNKTDEVNSIISEYSFKEEGCQKRVFEAMNYSFIAPGKRLRPMIVLETYRLFGGNDVKAVAPFMAAIEMIHTYSLIHDDLPAMDNDDYRRGRLTNHKVFDEATAILAGDGLLNAAFETMAEAMSDCSDYDTLKKMVKANAVLSKKAGAYGMIGGQTVDLMMEHKKDVDEDTLLFIHKCKTSALLEASLMMGAVLAGASDDKINALEEAGRYIGLAFQIQDDILDVCGDSAVIGKPVGSDEKNEKVTYVSLKGLDTAKREQEMYTQKAMDIIVNASGKDTSFILDLAKNLMTRKK